MYAIGEAGMYAIGGRRKTVTEKDFLHAVNKVDKGYQKLSAIPILACLQVIFIEECGNILQSC
ncbi:hypothetical protein Lalb_Chr01g0001601 [Lupinus albus]|uniref:Uncharacterized protein n=1 Tax=Lupinus albus TaxID=3870 RepID=A0A6A4R4J2_LUPAL|nr:hypothetical protein Lalb_Chr01g0001601 [Lupinus albus]